MSPSVLIYLSRLLVQMQCGRPREFDPTYSLRVFYGLILLCNTIILWIHALQGASEGRGLIIDFIGMCMSCRYELYCKFKCIFFPAYAPSKLQLLLLDFVILFLQFLTTIISYETQLYYTSAETDPQDVLLPETSVSNTLGGEYLSLASQDPRFLSPSDLNLPEAMIIKEPTMSQTPCIVDLRLSPIIRRLRNPAPPLPTSSDSLLPLPNTTSLPLPAGLRMIMGASANARTRRERERNGASNGNRSEDGRIPGGLG